MYNCRIFDVINHDSKNRNSDQNDPNEEEKFPLDKNTSFCRTSVEPSTDFDEFY